MSDLIDRQAAIRSPVKMISEGIEWIPVYHIRDLPSAEPERKTGKWGDHGECPFCSYLRQWEDDRFCGNCGADMRGDLDG